MTAPVERLALAAAAFTGLQVGAAMVATRYVAQDVGPATLALFRYAIAVLCLLPFVPAAGGLRFARGDMVAVMLLGVVQFGVLIALLNFGLRHMPATRAALLFTSFPLLTMALAAALGRERLTAAKTAGIALTMAGVAVTLGQELFAEPAEREWLGALAVLGAALSGAVCAVLYRPYLTRCPTLPVGALAMGAAVLFLAGPAGMEGLFAGLPPLDLGAWGAVLFIGLSSGIGYLLWLWALKHTTPTRVTVFLALGPVTAAVLSALLLHESPTPGTALGAAAVIGGLWLATRARPYRREGAGGERSPGPARR